MAVINPPGFLQNAGATHTAEQTRNWVDLMVAGKTGATTLLPRGGVNPALGNALQVTQSGSPAMSVVVKSGAATIPGSEGSKQGCYSVLNDNDVTLAIATAHASLNRIDIVCFKVEDTAYSGSTNAASLVVVTGTPAGSPVAPAAPNNSIIIAQVSIVANDTSITNGEITDRRQYMAATGGLISVADTTERNALTAHESLGVYRRDLDVIELYDSAAFRTWYPQFRSANTLGGTAGNITISSIPTSLKALRIMVTSRSNQAAAIAGLILQIGGDTGTNYRYRTIFTQSGGAPAITQGYGVASALVSYMPAATSTAGVFGVCVIDIVGWDRPHSNFLTGVSHGGYLDTAVNDITNNTQFAYSGSNTLNSILVAPDAGSFIAGTEVIVEGTYGP